MIKPKNLIIAGLIIITGVITPRWAAAAPAADKAERWPKDFTDLITAEKNGARIVSEAQMNNFKDLPQHAKEMFFSAVNEGILGSPNQLADLLSLDIKDEQIEIIMSDKCILCHTNENMQPEATLFKIRNNEKDEYYHLNIEEFVSDVHFRRGLSCSGCHGGDASKTEMADEIYTRMPDRETRKTDKTWIPKFCTDRCHSDAAFMREYNPSMPIDQMQKYKVSRHGQLLLGRKDSKAAQCVSCHGVHGIRNPLSPKSKVFKKNVPATCGKCHSDANYMKHYKLRDGRPIPTNQVELYKDSVHGKALFEKNDLGVPVCNNCHGNHAAMPADVAHIAQICRNCHVNNGSLFDGSPHKKVYEKYKWPECVVCHGQHNIQKPNDEMLGNGKQSVCNDCHTKYGKQECFETAEHFRVEITRIKELRAALSARIRKLSENGVDVADIQFNLYALDDSIVNLETIIHTFNKSEFDKIAQAANAKAEEMVNDLNTMENETRSRTTGIILSTLIITFFAFVLYLKIKEIDKITGYKR